MRPFARLSTIASLAAIAFTAACSDSTAPSQTPLQLARHFDSLYVQAAARSDTNGAYSNRALLLTFLEIPAALGATPATLTVTTSAGVEHWKAFEFVDVSTSSDSMFVMLTYRESDAHTMVVTFFNGAGDITDAGLIANDTIAVSPSDGTGTTSLFSVGSSCATPSSTLVNPQLSTLSISACNLATFHTSVSLTLPTAPQVDAALTSITFTSATINGIRVVDAPAGAIVRRVHAMLKAAASKQH
jgi:hypothetical protein